MTRHLIILPAALVALAMSAALSAQTTVKTTTVTTTAANHYSSAYTVGALIDNPATKAVLDHRIPGFTNAPQIPQIRNQALSTVEDSPDAGISIANRKLIEDDLSAIPANAPPQ